MMPDPQVVYQLVVAQPSGLTESLAEIRSEAAALTSDAGSNPTTPAGYKVAQVPKNFLLTPVRVLPPADVDNTGKERMYLETLLNRVGGPDEDSTLTMQPISSHRAFATAPANLRVSFPPPVSFSLRIITPLTSTELAELQALASSTVARDQAFRTAVGILVGALSTGAATAEAIAAIGLEALAEISDTVTLPTETTRTIVWAGLMSQDQRTAITGWVETSTFRQTLQALLNAADNRLITVNFSAPITKPTNADLPAVVRPALSVSSTQLTWTGLLMTDAQRLALVSLQQHMTLPQPFRDAVAALLTEATMPTAASTITVNVVESVWHPRPKASDLSSDFAAKLLLGVGQIAFRGLMTRAEGAALKNAVAVSAPDRSAIDQLFAKSLNAGLNGGILTIRTRRGGAVIDSKPVQATL